MGEKKDIQCTCSISEAQRLRLRRSLARTEKRDTENVW